MRPRRANRQYLIPENVAALAQDAENAPGELFVRSGRSLIIAYS
jgi:hypothetical protein